jgi:hypothetical protein
MNLPPNDSLFWAFASACVVMTACGFSLLCFYNTWETPKDVATISVCAAAYFCAHIGKRIIRSKRKET